MQMYYFIGFVRVCVDKKHTRSSQTTTAAAAREKGSTPHTQRAAN